MSDWKQKVKAENLPEQYRKFTDAMGLDAALSLFEQFGGEVMYIPKAQGAQNSIRNSELLRRYNAGESPTALCREYGITRSTFYKTIHGEIKGRNRK